MLTKQEVIEEYGGNPETGYLWGAPYRGEHWSTAVFWDLVMISCSDEVLYLYDKPYDIFHLKPEDHVTYEIPEEYSHVVLWESDNGFRQCDWMTEEDYSFFEEELLAEDEQGYE